MNAITNLFSYLFGTNQGRVLLGMAGLTALFFRYVWKNEDQNEGLKESLKLARLGKVDEAVTTFDHTVTKRSVENVQHLANLLIRKKTYWPRLEKELNTVDSPLIQKIKAFVNSQKDSLNSLEAAYTTYQSSGEVEESAKVLCKMAQYYKTRNQLVLSKNKFDESYALDSSVALSYKWNSDFKRAPFYQSALQQYYDSLDIPQKSSDDFLQDDYAAREFPKKDLKKFIKDKVADKLNKKTADVFESILDTAVEILSPFLSVEPARLKTKVKQEELAFRYCAHVLTLKGELLLNGNQYKLEGFSPVAYLPYRIAYLIDLIRKIEAQDPETIALIPQLNMSEEEVIEGLVKEIKIAAETASYSYMMFNANKQNKVAECSATILDRIKELPDGEEIVLPTGFKEPIPGGFRGHAMYVSFRKQKDNISITVFNRGAGKDKHAHNEERNKVAPYPFLPINVNQAQLKQYIEQIIRAKEKPSAEALPLIYEKKLLTPAPAQDEKQSVQKVGNCVVANYHASVKARVSDKFYKFIRQKEEHFALTAHKWGQKKTKSVSN